MTHSLLPVVALLAVSAGCVPEAEGLRPADPSAPDPTAPDPSADWTAEVAARIAADEYAIRSEGGVLRGVNRASDLRLVFERGQLIVTPRSGGPEVGLSLQAWGREGGVDDAGEAAAVEGPCVSSGAVDAFGDCLTRVVRERPGVQEWWENRPEGVEFGFEIASGPSGTGALVFDLEVTGAAVEVHGDVATLRREGGDALQLDHLAAWDARGVELPSWMEPTEGGLRLVVDDTDAVGPITVDPLLTTIAWSAESNIANAEFGWAVAGVGDVNGDGYGDVVVSATDYSGGERFEGRVWLYLGAAAGLSVAATWTYESNQELAYLGSDLSGGGDVNGDGYADLLLAQPVYQITFYNGGSLGAALVFFGSAAGLPATPSWTYASSFGRVETVAMAGDVNGDGYTDFAVGESDEYETYLQGREQVVVFLGGAAGPPAAPAWTSEGLQTWHPNGPYGNPEPAFEYFGYSLAAAGDVNGDGFGDLLVGARGYTGYLNVEPGGGYLYLGSAAGLGAAPAWSRAGEVVSMSSAGDVNGDGYADIALSDTSGLGGTAFVHLGSSVGPAAVAGWTGASTQAGEGALVAGAGDVNGDGYGDLLVGALGWDNGQVDEGRARLFLGGSAGLAATAAWAQESNEAGALFGVAASAGDIDGDGFGDVVIGMPYHTGGQAGEGGARLYRGSSAGLATTASGTTDSNQVGAAFATAVASAGDVNGDGYGDLVVGAPAYDNGQVDEGRVFLYHGSLTGLVTAAAWTKESHQVGASFGAAVTSAGDVNGDGYGDLLIGAPDFDNVEIDEGRAYLFLGSAAGLASVAWTSELDQAGAAFGSAMGSAGDVNGDGFSDVIVGAPDWDGGQADEGGAFVYLGSAGGLGASAWTAEQNQVSAGFGTSVAGGGDVNGDGFADVIVGAPLWDNGQADEGGAWAYLGSATGLATTPTFTGESNQAGARFGAAVAPAGDVHRDGYDDLLVGVPYWDNGQTDEGKVVLFRGRSTGVNPTGQWNKEVNQAGALFGSAVASAGDVNGDGYGDVIVGSPLYDNGQTDEGRASVYHGAVAGLGSTTAWTAEVNSASAAYGWSVAGAFDVNGDGYADVVVGAPGFESGETDEGRFRVFLGNGADGRGRGLGFATTTRQPGLATTIAPGLASTSTTSFAVYMAKAHGPWGRSKVKLQVEVEPLGRAFDGLGLVTTSSWSNTTLSGVARTLTVTGLTADTGYHWRARVLVSPAQAEPQGFGPWKYGGVSGSSLGGHVFTAP